MLHSAKAARAAIGTPVADAGMPTLDGRTARLLGDGLNVLVFFRPNQENSARGLRELARCRRDLAGKPVRWAGIVSDAVPADAVAALARDAGFDGPILVDRGDALYGSLGVALHPVAVIVGRNRTLAAFEPFRSIDYCTVVSARLRHALGEIPDEALRAALEPPKSSESGDALAARRYRALAEMQFKAGNADKALDSARKSVGKDPAFAAAHVLVGEILASQGKCPEGLRAFQEALSIEPSNAAAKAGAERCDPAFRISDKPK